MCLSLSIYLSLFYGQFVLVLVNSHNIHVSSELEIRHEDPVLAKKPDPGLYTKLDSENQPG